MVAASVFVSIPQFLGINNIGGYWFAVGMIGLLLAPMLSFLAAMISYAMGFPRPYNIAIGLVVALLLTVPALTAYLMVNGLNTGLGYFGAIWLTQLSTIPIATRIGM